MIVNKRNVAKSALLRDLISRPLQWTSKYASVTFNQYGWELPNGGMNEKGLTIEVLWLSETVLPSFDRRPTINESQIVQYGLDSFATTNELLKAIPDLRVTSIIARLHYYVCDIEGVCAVIEYLDGKLRISEKTDIITNDPVENSRQYLSNFEGFGGNKPIPKDSNSLSRFVRASHYAKKYNGQPLDKSIGLAFDILNQVLLKFPLDTYWQIVYDLKHQKVHFRALPTDDLITYDLNTADFSCRTPTLGYDLNNHASGNLADHFIFFTKEINETILKEGFGMLRFAIPEEIKKLIFEYPATTECRE